MTSEPTTRETFLRRALELARTRSADGRHGPFGAVVVRDNEVVGEGWNRVVEDRDPTAHAEMGALRSAAQHLGTHDLSGCVLYASCEPCPMCLAAIYWARIGEVHFAAAKEDAAEAGFDDSFILGEMGKGWEDRMLESSQTLEDEGSAILRAWAANPLRVPY